MKINRIRRRVYELLSKAAASSPGQPSACQRELHFIFFRKPVKFLDSEERGGLVSAVHLEKTTLNDKQIAVGTGEFEDIKCGLVLKSIGYKSIPIDDLPFNHDKGVVPNFRGRVLQSTKADEKQSEVGLYVCGWLKRGPTGIVATNLHCAEETVDTITQDLEQGDLAGVSSLPKPGREGLLQLLDNRNVKVVPFDAWEKIDNEEKERGSLIGKPREKLCTWEELLNVASK